MEGAISVGAALADGKVYAGQQGNERFLYCVDAKTGELVWKQTIPGGWVWGSAAVDGDLVYFGSWSHSLYAFYKKTGELLNEGNTNDEAKGVHSGFNASPAFTDGMAFFSARVGRGYGGVPLASRVYVLSADGYVHAIE